MKTVKALLFLPLVVNMIACAKDESPILQTEAIKAKSVTVVAGKTEALPDPKVNIIFVVDNSGSMSQHQITLQNNIKAFAKTFFNNPRIDYRIGIVGVYDRVSTPGAHECRLPTDVRKMNPRGELFPLKGVAGKYITRDTPNAAQILKDTVKIGVQCGPEAEESFEPVLAMLEGDINAKNDGFYEKDAHLVVIFLTDADDANPRMSAGMFYDKLVASKGGDKSKVLLAAAIPNSKGCAVDADAIKIREAVSLANGVLLDLCSNTFGQKLVDFGNTIAQQVATQEILIPFNPDDTLKVTYGSPEMRMEERQVIERKVGGYSLFSGKNSSVLVLDANLDIQRVDNGKVFIDARPISDAAYRDGRATIQGQ